MKRFKHVQQTNRFNCGSAIIAMLCGRTVPEVEALLRRNPAKRYPKLREHPHWPKDRKLEPVPCLGWSNDELCFVLFKLGIPSCHVFDREAVGYSAELCGDECSRTKPTIAECFGWVDGGDRALILGVEAEDENAQFAHWILATKATIHDPAYPKEFVRGKQPKNYNVAAGVILIDLRAGHLPSTFKPNQPNQ